ncbi:MAG: DUF6666 family protein [Pirellulaceae bacterium]
MARYCYLILFACTLALLGQEARAQRPNPVSPRLTSASPIPPALAIAPRQHLAQRKHLQTQGVRTAAVQIIDQPETYDQNSILEGGNQDFAQPNEPLLMASGCDSCGMTAVCCCNPAGFLLDWSRADIWVGVSGFASPGNFLTTGTSGQGQVEGNFGFQQGFNFGSRLPSLLGGQMGSQLGMRFTQTQLDGTTAGEDNRTQTFVTAGLFRRVDYGLQGGMVVDYLHDDWVYKADLVQIRGELSFLFSPCHDLGFRFTDSQQVDDTDASLSGSATSTPVKLAALNNYRFFYRYRYGERGRGLAEVQAGFSENSNAILGVSLKTPLQNQLGLETSAIYLIPSGDLSQPYLDEGWNMSMAIVWTPGRVFGTARDYYRPLLDVADNGSLLMRLFR